MSARVTITDYYLCLLSVHDKITTQKLIKSFIKIYSKIYNQIHVTTKILPFWQLVEFKWKFQATVLDYIQKNYNYIYMYSYEQMESCVQPKLVHLYNKQYHFLKKFSSPVKNLMVLVGSASQGNNHISMLLNQSICIHI